MIKTLKPDWADAPGELSVYAVKQHVRLEVSGRTLDFDWESVDALRSRLGQMVCMPDTGCSLWMSDGLDGLISHDTGSVIPRGSSYGPGIYRFSIRPKGSRDSLGFCLDRGGLTAFLGAVQRALDEQDVRSIMES